MKKVTIIKTTISDSELTEAFSHINIFPIIVVL